MPSVASDNNTEATPSPSPTWDGSPNTLPAFYEALIKFLPKKNANYRNLVEQGCRVEGRKTLFHSINHINRYVNNEIVNKKGEHGSFRAPVLVDRTSMHLITAASPTVYSVSPTDGSGELRLSDSPYDINSLAIDNLQRNMFDDITAGWED